MSYNIYKITLIGCDDSTEILVHLSPRDAQIIDMIGKLSKEAGGGCQPTLEITKDESRSH